MDHEEKAERSAIGAKSLFVAKGCAGCHRVRGDEPTPLAATTPEEALEALSFHRAKSDGFSIDLSAAREASMARALVAASEDRRSDLGLEEFWAWPPTSQGEAPAAYDEDAKDLRSSSCGTCHLQQYEDWMASRHRQATSLGSLASGMADRGNPADLLACQKCHAPLAEQYRVVLEGDDLLANESFDEDLMDEGVGCAACHVRSHVRYGPGRGENPPVTVWRGIGHGGGLELADFRRADFCAACHQFEVENAEASPGTVLDTYNEWSRSSHAEEGKTCQTCHMSAGRHRFQGIGDRRMVREALEITLEAVSPGLVEVRLTNRGAGHHLPTQSSSHLLVEALALDQHGSEIVSSRQERWVGRIWRTTEGEPTLDHRIPSGGTWVWSYPIPGEANSLALRIAVVPDRDAQSSFAEISALSSAKTGTKKSSGTYLLWEELWTVP